MDYAEHYAYRVQWSPEDESYLGTVVELPSLSWLDDSYESALAGIRRVAHEVLEDMLSTGESAPEPLADRPYSGKFQLRVPPDLHRALTLKAAEQGVSLNRYVTNRLASAA